MSRLGLLLVALTALWAALSSLLLRIGVLRGVLLLRIGWIVQAAWRAHHVGGRALR